MAEHPLTAHPGFAAARNRAADDGDLQLAFFDLITEFAETQKGVPMLLKRFSSSKARGETELQISILWRNRRPSQEPGAKS